MTCKLCNFTVCTLIHVYISIAQVSGKLEKQGMGTRKGIRNCTKRTEMRRLGAHRDLVYKHRQGLLYAYGDLVHKQLPELSSRYTSVNYAVIS